MRNAKKTLSLVMVAIFTTFIVLSGIPAGAVTTAQAKAQVTKATAAVVKVENVVKVASFNPTTAQTLNTAATKEVAKVNKLGKTYKATYLKLVTRYQAVNKKITARKAAILAASKKVYTDAEAAVTAAENATDGDKVDLVGDETALANAQSAVTTALEMIVKLNQDSSDYKGLMARIDAANNLIVKAMDEIAEAAAQKAIDDKLKAEAEAAAKALEAAIKVAETDVAALEAAPVTTLAEIDAAVVLGTKAAASVKAIANAEKAAPFAARIKVVADKGLAVKAAIEAKIAAELEAKKPATMLTVSAVDGTLSLTFDKKAVTTPVAADFTVKKAVDGAAATAVTGVTVNVVSDTAVTLVVPATVKTTKDQSVVYSVAYTTGAAITAAAYKVALDPALVAKEAAEAEAKIPATMVSVSAVDGTITVTFTKKPITTPAAVQFVVTKTVTTTSAVTTTVATADVTLAVVSDTTIKLTVPTLAAITVDQSVLYSVVYNATGAAVAAPAAFTIAKLPALTATAAATNLKEIMVTFNQAVDKTTAETVANYTGVGTVATAALQADAKTVKLTVATMAQNTALSLVITGVKAAASGLATTLTVAFTPFDVVIPVAQSYAFTGPQTIEITFSEPINAAGTALVDNGIYGASTALSTTKNNVVVVSLGTPLPVGAHTLKITGVVDFVPYTALDKTFDVTYVADTTVPTVTVASSTQTKVVLTFSKEVKGDALTASHFYHTYTSYVPTTVTDSQGAAIVASNYYTTVVLNFTASPLPAGSVKVVVLKTDGTTTITDRYANVLAADATLTATVAADTTAPTVTKVEATNESTLVLTYSEDVTGGATKANFVVKDSTGTVVADTKYGTPVYAGGTTLTSTITFTAPLAGGAYSVTVSNLKDASISANAMASVTLPFTVSDKTPVSAATAISVENTGTTADIIYVTYPELMTVSGVNSAVLLSNYKIGTTPANAVALPTDSTVAVFGTNDKVKVTIPGTGAGDLTGKNLYVRNLADNAGNVMTSLFIEIIPASDAAPVITAVKTTALNKVELTTDKQLSAMNASNIKIDADGAGGTTAAAFASYTNNSDGTATVSVILNATDVLPNEGSLPVAVEITNGAGIKSITGTAMAASADVLAGLAITPTDGVIPAFAAANPVTTYDTNSNGQIDAIVVAYTEAINKNTVSFLTYTSSYTVTGVAVNSQATAALAAANQGASANGKFVVLNVTEGTTPDTNALPTVTQVYSIKDVAGNTLVASAAKTAVDTAAPTMVTAKLYDGTTNVAKANGVVAVAGDYILVTFSEAITASTIDTTATVASVNNADFTLMKGAAAAGDTALNAGTTVTASVVDSKTVKLTLVVVNAADNTIANDTVVGVSNDVLTLKVGTVTDAAATPVANVIKTLVLK